MGWGLAGSASGGEPGTISLPLLPAVQATVRDACGWLTVFRDDAWSVPFASNLKFVRHQTAPNLVMIPVWTLSRCAQSDGPIDIYNAFGDVGVLADVFGYFTDANPEAGAAR